MQVEAVKVWRLKIDKCWRNHTVFPDAIWWLEKLMLAVVLTNLCLMPSTSVVPEEGRLPAECLSNSTSYTTSHNGRVRRPTSTSSHNGEQRRPWIMIQIAKNRVVNSITRNTLLFSTIFTIITSLNHEFQMRLTDCCYLPDTQQFISWCHAQTRRTPSNDCRILYRASFSF